MAENGSPILTDGSLNFQGGVDSLKPTTVATQANPNGLQRNQLAWMINATVRDGGISPRSGQVAIYKLVDQLDPALVGTSGWQGGFMYRPINANPYLIFSVGGVIYKADPAASGPVNLSKQFNLFNPANVDRAFFEQGEEFLIIQAGDGVTLPLFWDGNTLRRSVGLNPTQPATNPSFLVSTDRQSFNIPPSYQAFTMFNLTASPITLTWTTIGAITTGITVELKISQPDHNGPSLGKYQVTNIAGLALTLLKQDRTTAPLHFGPGNVDLLYTSIPASLLVPQVIITPELPAGYAMDYYMERMWFVTADQTVYTAGDIVANTASGTAPYGYRDSILKVTENPLAVGGDGFHIPSDGGVIRGLAHTAQLNAALGQGLLYVFTRTQIYSLQVPVSRGDWINANATNKPLQTIVQLTNGATGDRSIVGVNGDLYYQALEPSIRSLILAVRNFGQPGNVPISSPENRILQFTDRTLMTFASGTTFNNRMIQTALPKRIAAGVVHSALLPLDFTPVSDPDSTEPPVWEGHYEGLDYLQLFTADYGGLDRSFTTIVSRTDNSIWLWEMTQGGLTDNNDNRITWQVEWPAFNFTEDFNLKNLVGGELWVDRVSGTVEFALDYRPDGWSCYIPWIAWKICSARDCNENIPPVCPPVNYPFKPPQVQGLGYQQTIGFPKPPKICDTQMNRPSDIGHQFQPRLTIKGSCRIRGIFLHATPYKRELYSNLPCA